VHPPWSALNSNDGHSRGELAEGSAKIKWSKRCGRHGIFRRYHRWGTYGEARCEHGRPL